MKKFIAGLLIAAGLPVILIWAIGPLDLFVMLLGLLGQGLLKILTSAPWLMFP